MNLLWLALWLSTGGTTAPAGDPSHLAVGACWQATAQSSESWPATPEAITVWPAAPEHGTALETD